MKPKSVAGITRNPKELTFAWHRGDEALIRFWLALLMAAGILVAIWLSVRVVVPASMAPDRLRVDQAQWIVVTEDSDPSLRALLSDKSLPTLGLDEGTTDALMLEGMLGLLGLEAEEERSFRLYSEPVTEPSLTWPKEERAGFTLPALPEVSEDSWPRVGEPQELVWEVTLKGSGELSEFFQEKVLPWSDAVPAIRSSVWSIVLDNDGSLTFAGAVDSVDAKVEDKIRKKLQQLFESDLWGGSGVSGVVELKFEKKEG